MNTATIASGRLALMLAELRLPTVRRLVADLCSQSDRSADHCQVGGLQAFKYVTAVATVDAGLEDYVTKEQNDLALVQHFLVVVA